MYLATFKKRNERDLVEAARRLLGQSQGEFTRTLLLKESVVILQRAQQLSKQESISETAQSSDTSGPSEDALKRSNVDSTTLADPQTV